MPYGSGGPGVSVGPRAAGEDRSAEAGVDGPADHALPARLESGRDGLTEGATGRQQAAGECDRQHLPPGSPGKFDEVPHGLFDDRTGHGVAPLRCRRDHWREAGHLVDGRHGAPADERPDPGHTGPTRQQLGEAASNEAECLSAWAQSRDRFLGRPTTPAAPQGNEGQ